MFEYFFMIVSKINSNLLREYRNSQIFILIFKNFITNLNGFNGLYTPRTNYVQPVIETALVITYSDEKLYLSIIQKPHSIKLIPLNNIK